MGARGQYLQRELGAECGMQPNAEKMNVFTESKLDHPRLCIDLDSSCNKHMCPHTERKSTHIVQNLRTMRVVVGIVGVLID